MNGSGIASEWLVALFLLAVLVLNPPFLLIFDTSAQVAGIPVLYLYLFVAWAALIVFLALITEQSKAEKEGDTGEATPATGRDPDDLEGSG